MENLKAGKYCGNDEGGILVTQERMKYFDASKVDANEKEGAPDTSNAFDGSKIDTPKINVKRGKGKICSVAITLSQRLSLRQQALRDSQPDGEGSDTGKFDAKKEAKKEEKKEATKADAKRKSDAILTYRGVSLTQKALRETNSSGVGGGE